MSNLNSLTFIYFAIGLVALIKGADIFTNSASKIARHYGLSELVIGLTLVAFATSLPELAVSATASFFHSYEIALGNVIGSNIANVGLVIGLSALAFPIVARSEEISECLVMIGVLMVASILFIFGLVFWEGILLVMFLFAYVWSALREHKRILGKKIKTNMSKNIILCLIGVAGVVAGSRFVVISSVEIARWAGISEMVIGMTLIAIGTSLPELATSFVAAFRGMRELALGNIIGSNVFNISAVLGISALLNPIPVASSVLMFDVPIMIAFSVLMLIFMWTRKKIGRIEGGILLLLYLGFLCMNFL
ncbi:MAG: calcium/sodium antiporter [archaeon]